MRRTLAIVALVLATAAPVYANGPGLPTPVKVEAGFDGLAKPGKWAPVAVTLKNEGADFTGELRFESKAQFGPAPQVNIYRTPVTIPAGGTKRVQLHMPLEGIGNAMPAVTLASADGRQSAPVPVKLEAGTEMIVGVLGVEPEQLRSITGMKLGAQAVRLARLDPAAMPAEAIELENLDALLLDRFTWSELPEPQRRAVEAWVEHGGTLIAAGGPEAKRLEGLSPWVPLQLTGVATVPVEGVGAAPVAQLDLAGGRWRVTRSAGTAPLVASLGKGSGRIYLLTFDPALEPFASWSGLPALMQGLLPPGQPFAGMGNQNPAGMKAQYVLLDTLANFPLAQSPASKGLLIMLGVYAVLIGPVHFLLLRGFRRLGWAILSLPLLAAIGAGSTWAYAREARRSDVMLNVISLIQGQPDGHFLKVNSLAGIHMPPQSTHTVALGDALLQAVAQPPIPGPNGQLPQALPPATIDQGRSARLAPINEWHMRGMAGEGMVPVAGTVTGEITVADQQAEGRLTNHLPFALKDAMVISNGTFQKIGDLNTGASADVSLQMLIGSPEFAGNNNMVGDAIARAYQGQGPGVGPRATREQFMQMLRPQLGWAAASAMGYGQLSPQTPLMLVGWTEASPLPIAIDQRADASQGMGLYIQPLPFSFGRGAMTVGTGFLTGHLAAGSEEVFPGGLNFGWSVAKDQAVTFDFDLPAALAGRVEQAQVKVPVLKQAPGEAYPVAIAYYRWSDGAWVEPGVENGGARPVTGPGFVSPAGTVRIRIRQTSQQQWPLGIPALTVRVKEAQP